MNILYDELEGFEQFMDAIASNLLRDSMYGTVHRVSIGAVSSAVDAATDIYVIFTYYETAALVGRAHTLLAMICMNIFLQIYVAWMQYKKKSITVKLREVLITLLFLRPAVDAYRVSTNHDDEEASFDPLIEMMGNKCAELACESILGCVLQMYVYLAYPNEAGSFALVSILISALTTGYTSAMIAFDMDVDVEHRRGQPTLYGYIPDDNGLRGRCFTLMTLIGMLHNLSRSVGCALLAATDKNIPFAAIGGEMLLFLLYKLARGDFWYRTRLEGVSFVIIAFVTRIIVKVIVAFSRCLHFRHPYEMGGATFSMSMLWAQIFPFIALMFFEDNDNKEAITIFLVWR